MQRNILTVIGTYAFSNLYSHETLGRRENNSERETTEEVKEGCQRIGGRKVRKSIRIRKDHPVN